MTAFEANTSLSEEAELPQQELRCPPRPSGGNQLGCDGKLQVDMVEYEPLGAHQGHGDSGVEADLSALNLCGDDISKYFIQDSVWGEDAMVNQISNDSTASNARDALESVKTPGHDFCESRKQVCQKRKGRSMKRKEVVMSFGMVKCDGGARQEQKNMSKAGGLMAERVKENDLSQENKLIFQSQKKPGDCSPQHEECAP